MNQTAKNKSIAAFLGSVFYFVLSNGYAHQISVKVLSSDNKPVSDIVVYAMPKSGLDGAAKDTREAIIKQSQSKFSPYVSVVQSGQSIRFTNEDDFTHHIYSVSGENRFDFKLKAESQRVVETSGVAEEIAMGCNIHDWMSGYVLVVDTPFFAMTNAQGVAELNVLNADDYELTLWHPQMDYENNRLTQVHNISLSVHELTITLANALLPIPEQTGQDDFEFLEDY